MQIRCMNCMCLTEQTQGLCPKCGQPLEVCNEPPALGVSTVLRERYLIGAVYTSNGEGYTYSAFDMIENKAVYVREFFPKGKVSRMEDGVTMSVPAAVTTSCLGWVSSFIALHQKLKSMGSTNCIAPCIDLFNANETAYAVLEANAENVLCSSIWTSTLMCCLGNRRNFC